MFISVSFSQYLVNVLIYHWCTDMVLVAYSNDCVLFPQFFSNVLLLASWLGSV